MKYKAKKYIPIDDEFKGLSTVDWDNLNNGEVVELKKVPRKAVPYLEKETKKKDDE